VALILWLVPPSLAGWAIAPALLVGGLGGGLVISPNITMTLRCVPVWMAGAAGAALQTGQRVGAAIGTATLPGLFYLVLGATGNDFGAAVATSLVAATVGVAAALVIAVVEWRREAHRPHDGCRDEQPAEAHP
jgi:MFS family permease